jgi:hypothetical protein
MEHLDPARTYRDGSQISMFNTARINLSAGVSSTIKGIMRRPRPE